MAIPLLRILTLKSKIKVGKYADYTVQELLNLGRTKILLSIYYKITSINYNQEVLDLLQLTSEWQIDKPGANKEFYYEFLKAKGKVKNPSRGTGPDAMMIESRLPHLGYLKQRNENGSTWRPVFNK